MQALEGVSLEAQSEKIKAYCKLHDVELIGIYKDEGLSAKSLERPGLQSALTMLERGKANTLLVVKLDRLTRALLDLDMFIRGYFTKERYHLLSVSESLDTRTAMGRFVLYIRGLIAQWEREAIGERTREAMAHLKQQGVPLGATPYGFLYSNERDDAGRKRIVEVPEQMEVIARIVKMFDAGSSARKIAERLSAEGILAPRGGPWYGTMVRRILARQQRPNRRPRKPNRSGPALFAAIDPKRELAVCALWMEMVSAGKPLVEAGPASGILTPELAKSLALNLGQRATVLTYDRDGVMSALDFDFVGLYGQPGFPLRDKKIGFIPLALAQTQLRMEGRATQIAIAIENLDDASASGRSCRKPSVPSTRSRPGTDSFLSALALCGRQALRLLDHGELP